MDEHVAVLTIWTVQILRENTSPRLLGYGLAEQSHQLKKEDLLQHLLKSVGSLPLTSANSASDLTYEKLFWVPQPPIWDPSFFLYSTSEKAPATEMKYNVKLIMQTHNVKQSIM